MVNIFKQQRKKHTLLDVFLDGLLFCVSSFLNSSYTDYGSVDMRGPLCYVGTFGLNAVLMGKYIETKNCFGSWAVPSVFIRAA